MRVGYPRHQAHRESTTQAPTASISRLAYRHEQYQRPTDAIRGMREQLAEGWRIVQIRGPANGPFEVVYLKDVNP
jgi:hypothetical protein